jgi:hypothetical protein
MDFNFSKSAERVELRAVFVAVCPVNQDRYHAITSALKTVRRFFGIPEILGKGRSSLHKGSLLPGDGREQCAWQQICSWSAFARCVLTFASYKVDG